MPTDSPADGAGNKVEIDNLLEAHARRSLCPVLPSVTGTVEDDSIGRPPMLHIEKVYRTEGSRYRRGTLPGHSSIVREIDVRGNATACGDIRKGDRKDTIRGREKCG